ncbi:hypothetical protein OIO90_001976 [Microbotryomycetes sp. JL221]|nr:hypothetical protein OIO90_001976 [Microbotryomycetes sp. JL221]
MSACKSFVSKVWKSFVDTKGHDYTSFGHLNVIDATPGVVKASMVVKDHQGLWMTGVSTDINVTYVRAAQLGEQVRIRSEVVGQGKTLAYTRIEMTSEKTGKLLAFGSHTKFIQLALAGKHNVKFSDDGSQIIEGSEPQ